MAPAEAGTVRGMDTPTLHHAKTMFVVTPTTGLLTSPQIEDYWE